MKKFDEDLELHRVAAGPDAEYLPDLNVSFRIPDADMAQVEAEVKACATVEELYMLASVFATRYETKKGVGHFSEEVH